MTLRIDEVKYAVLKFEGRNGKAKSFDRRYFRPARNPSE